MSTVDTLGEGVAFFQGGGKLGRQLPRICTDLQDLNTFKILAIFLGKGGLLPFFMFYCIFITKFSENLGFRGDLCGVHPLDQKCGPRRLKPVQDFPVWSGGLQTLVASFSWPP